MVSHSLLPLLTDATDGVRYGYVEQSGSTVAANEAGQSVRNAAGYRYLKFQDHHEELYHVLSDPNEQTNLLASPLSPEAQGNYSALQLQLATYVNLPNPTGGPLETSWVTYAGAKYARLYRTQAEALAGNAGSTWVTPFGTVQNGSQTSPAYAGVQSLRVSANWVYVTSSGLANHPMGPWYFDAAKTQLFVTWPQKLNGLFRFPRTPFAAVAREATPPGAIAVWVDGTIVYNQLDGFAWNGTADAPAPGGVGSWQRNARNAEFLTFDRDGAHRPASGEHHHHLNPKGLRHWLGDHMTYNPATHTYTEGTAAPHHSPILGWAFDGCPIYGPYGYADPNDPASPVRRLVSGYVLRDGSFATANLTLTGRTSYPPWALAMGQPTTPNGPPVSPDFPLGWYVQDYDHLADHGYPPGVDFDLDRYNGRMGRTPEFPGGTYAYFVTINADGTPPYPYVIGRQYYGVKTGGQYGGAATTGFTSVETPTVTSYLGGTNSPTSLKSPAYSNAAGSTITLTWVSTEGGRYQIEATDDLSRNPVWTVTTNNLPGDALQTQRTLSAPAPRRFYRTRTTAFDPFDEVVTS